MSILSLALILLASALVAPTAARVSFNTNVNDVKASVPASPAPSPYSSVAPSQSIDPKIDCAFRQLTINAVKALQPMDWPFASNWSALAAAALRMAAECSSSELAAVTAAVPQVAIPLPPSNIKQATCEWTAYVDGNNGDDSNSGSMSSPFKTVAFALGQSRLRTSYTACLYFRAGTYYLGETPPAFYGEGFLSQVGAIALNSIDSGLTLSAYKGETVVFSGGRLITPQWKLLRNVSAGAIYQTTLPADLSYAADRFNELYFDDWHGIRAKTPNGDPYTHGRYSTPSGYNSGARGWLDPKPYPPATEIHVATPTRDNVTFPTFQLGVGGRAFVFDPPHNFWSTDDPPQGANYVVPSGVIYNDGQVPNAKLWSKPSTGLVHAFHGGSWGSQSPHTTRVQQLI